MDIQATRTQVAKYILGINNPRLLQKVIDLLKSESDDWYHGLSSGEIDEINLGIKQLEQGQRVSLEELLSKLK